MRHPKPLPKLVIDRHVPYKPGAGMGAVTVGTPGLTVGWVGVIVLGVIGVLAVTHSVDRGGKK